MKTQNKVGKRTAGQVLRKMYKDRQIYLLLLPAIVITIVFAYGPMPGLIMALRIFQFMMVFGVVSGLAWKT